MRTDSENAAACTRLSVRDIIEHMARNPMQQTYHAEKFTLEVAPDDAFNSLCEPVYPMSEHPPNDASVTSWVAYVCSDTNTNSNQRLIKLLNNNMWSQCRLFYELVDENGVVIKSHSAVHPNVHRHVQGFISGILRMCRAKDQQRTHKWYLTQIDIDFFKFAIHVAPTELCVNLDGNGNENTQLEYTVYFKTAAANRLAAITNTMRLFCTYCYHQKRGTLVQYIEDVKPSTYQRSLSGVRRRLFT
jgi:hypothetical protein